MTQGEKIHKWTLNISSGCKYLHRSRFSRETERIEYVCVCVRVNKEIYFKELDLWLWELA